MDTSKIPSPLYKIRSIKTPDSPINIQRKLYPVTTQRPQGTPTPFKKVKNELNKLIDDGQIIKLEKCPDDLFISPVVITVKKDKSVKIALDSKKLSDALQKNKCQMQGIDHLIDSVALYISERKNLPGQYWFSKVDLKYAYSQIPLEENIQKHYNFNILGGRATGTYRFINGFYALTDMPATFQKNNRQNTPKHKYKICISRRHLSDNERKSTRPRK